jgi:hypothetical protein
LHHPPAGVLRFTNAKCLEATLCNTCGVGGGGTSSSVQSDIADLKNQQDTLIAAVAAINTRIDNINTSTTLANLQLWAGVRGFDSTVDYSAVTAWQHIMTMGCSSVLTTGTTGNPGDGCWKVRRLLPLLSLDLSTSPPSSVPNTTAPLLSSSGRATATTRSMP